MLMELFKKKQKSWRVISLLTMILSPFLMYLSVNSGQPALLIPLLCLMGLSMLVAILAG